MESIRKDEMASNGYLDLKTSTVQAMYEAINEYQPTVVDALYDLYKSAYTLSYTNAFQGDSADAFKNYLREGTINVISGLMDVVSELTTNMQLISACFGEYETATDGEINETELDTLDTELDAYKKTYDDYYTTLSATLNKAAQYISLVDVDYDLVSTGFETVKSTTKQIRTDLADIDEKNLITAQEMLDPNGVKELKGKDWYKPQTNVALTQKLKEDPFSYNADSVSVSENQWAAGLCSDVYAYAGYTWLGAEYESGREGDTVF